MSRYDDSHPEPSLKEKEPVRIGQLHHRDVETDDNVGVVVDVAEARLLQDLDRLLLLVFSFSVKL